MLNEAKIKELFGGTLQRYVDGLDAVYDNNVLYLALFYSIPTSEEIEDFNYQNGDMFYITTIEDAMFVSMKIGLLPLAESSFHIKRQINNVTGFPDTTSLSLCIFLVDSVHGKICGNKTIKASDGFRSVFFAEAKKQLNHTEKQEENIREKAIRLMYENGISEMAKKMNKESFFIS